MLRQTLKLFAANLGILLLISLAMGITMTPDVAFFALPIPLMFFIATTITALIALLTFLRIRSIPYPSATNKYSSSQRASTIVPVPCQDVVAFIRQYCDDQPWRVVSEDERQGILSITTAPSAFSWGEKIQIIAKNRGDGMTEVTIESKPRLPTVVMDGGASLKNVGRIVEMLQKRAPSFQP